MRVYADDSPEKYGTPHRYQGATAPREDLPAIGDEVAVLSCPQLRPHLQHYYGPLIVTAIEHRPRGAQITVQLTTFCVAGGIPFKCYECHDRALTPFGWNFVEDLSDEERAPIEAHRKKVYRWRFFDYARYRGRAVVKI
jgi:hypothetical protein